MLVLTRKEAQSIVINDNGTVVNVKVLEVSGNSVKLGIAAPDYVQVDREEIALQRRQDTGQ